LLVPMDGDTSSHPLRLTYHSQRIRPALGVGCGQNCHNLLAYWQHYRLRPTPSTYPYIIRIHHPVDQITSISWRKCVHRNRYTREILCLPLHLAR
jgi:hypothetical protein